MRLPTVVFEFVVCSAVFAAVGCDDPSSPEATGSTSTSGASSTSAPPSSSTGIGGSDSTTSSGSSGFASTSSGTTDDTGSSGTGWGSTGSSGTGSSSTGSSGSDSSGTGSSSTGLPCEDADEDGWTTCEGDCDDTLYFVHPGQDAFFTVPLPSGSFDYNCDGEETVERTEIQMLLSGYPTCETLPGWTLPCIAAGPPSDTYPDCGVPECWGGGYIAKPTGAFPHCSEIPPTILVQGCH